MANVDWAYEIVPTARFKWHYRNELDSYFFVVCVNCSDLKNIYYNFDPGRSQIGYQMSQVLTMIFYFVTDFFLIHCLTVNVMCSLAKQQLIPSLEKHTHPT